MEEHEIRSVDCGQTGSWVSEWGSELSEWVSEWVSDLIIIKWAGAKEKGVWTSKQHACIIQEEATKLQMQLMPRCMPSKSFFNTLYLYYIYIVIVVIIIIYCLLVPPAERAFALATSCLSCTISWMSSLPWPSSACFCAMCFRHDVNSLNDWATGDASMPEHNILGS